MISEKDTNKDVKRAFAKFYTASRLRKLFFSMSDVVFLDQAFENKNQLLETYEKKINATENEMNTLKEYIEELRKINKELSEKSIQAKRTMTECRQHLEISGRFNTGDEPLVSINKAISELQN